MKKIVGIIAALALASAVFADPDVTPTVSKFDGNASIEYDFNLDDTKFGIVNGGSADFEIKFVAKGDKATTGDGLWGELKIKVGDDVKVAGGNEAFKVPTASIDTAKIHFTDDDFYAVMNIQAPSLELGNKSIVTATWSAKDTYAKPSVTLADKAGFTLNFGLKDVVDFNFQFADNGVVKADAKKFAFLFDATLKAVENLGLYAGIGYGTTNNKLIAAVNADYKLGLTDALYLKPVVGFALNETGDKNLGAGVLFGWGGEGKEPNFAKFKGTYAKQILKDDGTVDKNIGDDGEWDNVPNKCADGFSVYAAVPLKKDAEIPFLVSVYDSTLVENLKMGAEFYAPNITKMDAGWAADVAVAWASGDLLGDWKVSANFGAEIEKLAEVKAGFLWGCGVENGAIIDNTTLYLNYAGQAAEDIQKLNGDIKGFNQKGTIKLGAKIHF